MKFNFLKFKKISWKLTITYSLIFSLVLIFLNAGILYGVRYFLIQQAVNQVESSAKITNEKIKDTLNDEFPLSNPEILDEANSEISIKIIDTKGNVVNASSHLEKVNINPVSHLGRVWLREINENHFTIKNEKIIFNGRIRAYLQVVKSMQKEYAFIKLLFVLMAIADSIGVIISLLAGYIISRKMLKPIDRITSAAKAISISDLDSRLEVESSNDELSRLSITFNEMLDRLKVSFEKQNQFVSDASHELRTPISVIQGYINLIDRWGKDDKTVLQESIDAIKKESSSMKDLTEKLLFLAKGDSSKLELNRENFLLNDLVEEIIIESTLLSPSHKFAHELKEEIIICADKKMMKQMLRALIDNSIKFTPADGKIKINAGLLTDQIKIVVSDTGIGIPKNEIDAIFSRFYRVDKARSKETGGSGLGLSIVKWIVDAHNGKIFVESLPEKGTDINILFPSALN